jgi:hypothetical protein
MLKKYSSPKEFLLQFLIIPFLLLAEPSFARAIGFQAGNIWELTQRQGEARYSCQNGDVIVPTSQNCAQQILLPSHQDYFYHPPLSKGNQVRLTAQHGETWIVQTRAWNRTTGASLNRFELFDAENMSSSLLHLGVNKINFVILQNNEAIETGSFQVAVKMGAPQTCEPLYLGIVGPNDYYRCLSDKRICKEYLQDLATCH